MHPRDHDSKAYVFPAFFMSPRIVTEESQGTWVQDLTPSQTVHLPQGQICDLSESQMPPLTGNGISLIERLYALNEITYISVVHRT